MKAVDSLPRYQQAVASEGAQHLLLLVPPHREVLPQLLQAEAVGLVATQDGLDDVGREAGEPQHSADVGAIDAFLRQATLRFAQDTLAMLEI